MESLDRDIVYGIVLVISGFIIGWTAGYLVFWRLRNYINKNGSQLNIPSDDDLPPTDTSW